MKMAMKLGFSRSRSLGADIHSRSALALTAPLAPTVGARIAETANGDKSRQTTVFILHLGNTKSSTGRRAGSRKCLSAEEGQ